MGEKLKDIRRAKFWREVQQLIKIPIDNIIKNVLKFQDFDDPQILLTFENGGLDTERLEEHIRSAKYWQWSRQGKHLGASLQDFYGEYQDQEERNEFKFTEGQKIILKKIVEAVCLKNTQDPSFWPKLLPLKEKKIPTHANFSGSPDLKDELESMLRVESRYDCPSLNPVVSSITAIIKETGAYAECPVCSKLFKLQLIEKSWSFNNFKDHFLMHAPLEEREQARENKKRKPKDKAGKNPTKKKTLKLKINSGEKRKHPKNIPMIVENVPENKKIALVASVIKYSLKNDNGASSSKNNVPMAENVEPDDAPVIDKTIEKSMIQEINKSGRDAEDVQKEELGSDADDKIDDTNITNGNDLESTAANESSIENSSLEDQSSLNTTADSMQKSTNEPISEHSEENIVLISANEFSIHAEDINNDSADDLTEDILNLGDDVLSHETMERNISFSRY